jgi:uncharacterized surface protein with fasciclin (FAS1) repeats
MNMLDKLMSLSESDFSRRKTIVEVLRVKEKYKILLMALKETRIDLFLSRPGPFTLFAPNDAAFDKVPKLAELLSDTKRLKSVIYRHICAGRFDQQSLGGVAMLRPIEGEALDTGARGNLIIQDAHIVEPNLLAWNGVAHGIDKVLIRENHSWLREAGAELEERLKMGSAKANEWIQTGTQKLEAAISKTIDAR